MSVSKEVAAKTALNAKNLEALGAERLAELLIEISTGNAAAKRRLRLELAGAQSPAELAKEMRRRLATIARSRSFIDWQGIRSLADDLEAQRRAIVETMVRKDPREALDLLWRFMALAPSILDRCDDSNGTVISVFHDACSAIGDVALAATPDATGSQIRRSKLWSQTLHSTLSRASRAARISGVIARLQRLHIMNSNHGRPLPSPGRPTAYGAQVCFCLDGKMHFAFGICHGRLMLALFAMG